METIKQIKTFKNYKLFFLFKKLYIKKKSWIQLGFNEAIFDHMLPLLFILTDNRILNQTYSLTIKKPARNSILFAIYLDEMNRKQ